MKLRATGILLALLILVAVMVPAFAAVVDRVDDDVSDVGVETEAAIGSAEKDLIMEEGSTAYTPPKGEVIATLFETHEIESGVVVSDSPFYLDGCQLVGLVYKQFSSVDYVTVESFMEAMDPEAVVEEKRGAVSVSAVTLSGVMELEGKGALNANVEEETLTLRAEKGKHYVEANGRYLYVKNTIKTIDGKVAAPIKVLAQVFNLKVKYDDDGLIRLTTKEGADAYLEDGSTYYNSYTLYWLSHIINAESGNQSLKGKIAVGNVVMNRVKSAKFPNNIKDVIFQKNQFSPAASGSIYRSPNKESEIAAKLVMDGAVVVKYALFFNREGMNTYAARNRTYVTTIGGHDFYN